MPVCSVLICKNRSGRLNRQDCKISYHKFPSDSNIKEKWISAAGRPDDWFPTKSSRICSAHFEESDFQVTNKSRRLNPWAVPTRKIRLIYAEHKELSQAGPSRAGTSAPLINSDAKSTDATDTPKPRESQNTQSLEQCRFCGEFTKDCVKVTSEMPYLVDNRTAFALNVVSVNLDFNDDTLPKTVCRLCDEKLQEINDFLYQVKAAQDKLINIKEESSEAIETVIIKTESYSPTPEGDENESEETSETGFVAHTVFTHKRKTDSQICETDAKKQKKNCGTAVAEKRNETKASKLKKKDCESKLVDNKEITDNVNSESQMNSEVSVFDTGSENRSELEVATSALHCHLADYPTKKGDVKS